MIIKLENTQCTAVISLHGAELKSFQNQISGDEYLWQADPGIWNRSAPFLFPNVGRLKSNTYVYENKKYHLSQHGFLRDVDFELKQKTDDYVILCFRSNQETSKVYPFQFEITIDYLLEGNSLSVGVSVKNIDNKTIYFSYGNHAGFMAPINPELNFEDYYLEVNPNKIRERFLLNNDKQIDLRNSFKENKFPIQLDHNLFTQDALIYRTEGPTTVTLKSDKDSKKLVISFEDFDYVGIWSPYPKLGDFVCIQPWCGIADTVDTNQRIDEKLGMYHLKEKETFSRRFTISIY
ncbi:aldose 1-epimerase family protein [Enterococcus avium]|uniref:aldose 1-epimerase family protein n=1 Tax=Enterococcus avium TaxID=33945 RepID=UPI002A9101F0|nr:aldose 1-epimerase family protein [Enterococcus avium]MDY6447852.1 aldose 1-epimerase family protein [Enterococcus avium]MDY6454310.1 aldose 1-epimerase family protein [Enterococcus avium]